MGQGTNPPDCLQKLIGGGARRMTTTEITLLTKPRGPWIHELLLAVSYSARIATRWAFIVTFTTHCTPTRVSCALKGH